VIHDLLVWHGWTDLTLLACVAGLVGCVSFVIRYHLLTRGAWRDYPEGRWMVYGRLIIAAVLLVVVANRAFPGWPARRVITFAIMAAFAAQTYWPLSLVNRAHRGHVHQRIGEHRK
jgi:hypothetical protein